MCVCVCVCVSGKEREREREGDKYIHRSKERPRQNIAECQRERKTER